MASKSMMIARDFAWDCFDSFLDEKGFDGCGFGDNFAIAVVGGLRDELEPVERGARGEGLATIIEVATLRAERISFSRSHPVGWIESERIVIVEIFVSHRRAFDALSKEFGDAVLDESLIAAVLETAGKATYDATT